VYLPKQFSKLITKEIVPRIIVHLHDLPLPLHLHPLQSPGKVKISIVAIVAIVDKIFKGARFIRINKLLNIVHKGK